MIMKLYGWFLWVTGFKDKDGNYGTLIDREMVTFMLRRQKERLGYIWWALALGSILGSWTAALLLSWWYVILVVFLCWLLVHVCASPNTGRKTNP